MNSEFAANQSRTEFKRFRQDDLSLFSPNPSGINEDLSLGLGLSLGLS